MQSLTEQTAQKRYRLRSQPAQHRAAKVVGVLYLVQMAFAIFGESFVRNRLIVPRDAVQTAANLVASERLFRLSLAGDLMIYASVIVLFWGIYIILKPVNKDVALLGASSGSWNKPFSQSPPSPASSRYDC